MIEYLNLRNLYSLNKTVPFLMPIIGFFWIAGIAGLHITCKFRIIKQGLTFF